MDGKWIQPARVANGNAAGFAAAILEPRAVDWARPQNISRSKPEQPDVRAEKADVRLTRRMSA